MAEAIGIALLTWFGVEATVTAVAIATVAVGVVTSVGLSLLAQSFLAPSTSAVAGTPPSDRQFIAKGSVLPRDRSYGRVRAAGGQMFVGAKGGDLHRVLAHHHGLIDGIDEVLVDEDVVTIGGDGWVTAPTRFAGRVRVLTRDGRDDPAHYTDLAAAFPEWDASHLGRGIMSSHTVFKQVGQSDFADVYPAAEGTTVKITFRGVRIWDPRDPGQSAADPSTWTYSDNAVLAILDLLRHDTGLGVPIGVLLPDLDMWRQAADRCDDAIGIKAGGTIPRYRAWGSYKLDERPGDVLGRLMTACNARFVTGPNGGIGITVGAWETPAVTLGDDQIVSYKIGSGNEGPEAANTLSAVYTEPDQGYEETEAAPWFDAAAVTAVGEEVADAKLYFVPHHNQARRLMKQAMARLAPEWKGTIVVNLAGLAALSERFVRIVIGELGIDVYAEIDTFSFNIEDGSVVTGASIQWTSIEPEVFAFDAATEEGDAAETPPDIAADTMTAPQGFGISIASRGSGGSSYAVAVATWDAYTATGVRVQIEYRVASAGDWLQVAPSTEGATTAETPPLTDGVDYEFRARAIGVIRSSAYTAVTTRTVTVDPTSPAVPVSLSTSAAGSTVTIDWTNPGSANTYGARVYRHTSNSSAGATLIATRYAGPNVALTYDDAGLAAGTYWWWVAAINGSGVESARTAAGTHTI